MGRPAPSRTRGTLGLGQGTALYIASVLGTGILVLPGLAAAAAGPASIVAVAAVLVLSIPLAGTFASLAARYPDPGGVASYVRRTLGGTAARMTGYWFFFGVCIGAPVLAVLGGEYVVAVLGVDRAAVPIIALAIFVPPFVANWFGVRVAGWVQFVLTGLLITVVVGVVAVTFPAVEASNFQPFLPNGWAGVGTAISLFVWAFAGWEVGTHIAGEFKNPRRIIPLATGIAIVVVGAGYLALQVVTVGVLGDQAGAGVVPLLDLVETTVPGIGSTLVAIVTAIVCLGVMNAYLPAFAKLGAALGRDGDLPQLLREGRRQRRDPASCADAHGSDGRRVLRADAPQRHEPVGLHPHPHEQHGRDLRRGHARSDPAAAPLVVRLVARGHRHRHDRRPARAGLGEPPRAAHPRAWLRCSSPSCAACAGPAQMAHRRPTRTPPSCPNLHGSRQLGEGANRTGERAHPNRRGLHMTEYRAHFDAEITFVNGGALRAEAFRLDLPSAELTADEIGDLLVRHLGLALVGSVALSNLEIVEELHRGSRGVIDATDAMTGASARPCRTRAASSSTSASRSAPGS